MLLNVTNENIAKIVNSIEGGGLVAFPTETVYALACGCDKDQAIQKLYNLKERDTNKPFSVLASNLTQIDQFAELDFRSIILFEKFSPGPLTIILKKKTNDFLSPFINQLNNTIGVRIPDHLIALNILNKLKKPVIATSANISGQNSATKAHEVEENFGSKLDFIIDAGSSKLGTSSTVIDFTGKDINIIRKGIIDEQQILAAFNR